MSEGYEVPLSYRGDRLYVCANIYSGALLITNTLHTQFKFRNRVGEGFEGRDSRVSVPLLCFSLLFLYIQNRKYIIFWHGNEQMFVFYFLRVRSISRCPQVLGGSTFAQ